MSSMTAHWITRRGVRSRSVMDQISGHLTRETTLTCENMPSLGDRADAGRPWGRLLATGRKPGMDTKIADRKRSY